MLATCAAILCNRRRRDSLLEIVKNRCPIGWLGNVFFHVAMTTQNQDIVGLIVRRVAVLMVPLRTRSATDHARTDYWELAESALAPNLFAYCIAKPTRVIGAELMSSRGQDI
jgi:hypothetical protein